MISTKSICVLCVFMFCNNSYINNIRYSFNQYICISGRFMKNTVETFVVSGRNIFENNYDDDENTGSVWFSQYMFSMAEEDKKSLPTQTADEKRSVK